MNIALMTFVLFGLYGILIIATFGILYWLFFGVLGGALKYILRNFFFYHRQVRIKKNV